MKTRIALAGFGFMGQMHARVYQALSSEVEIVGIADPFAGAIQQMTSLGLDVPLFGSLAELMASVECDAVDICLPTDKHGSSVVEAARAGKHVFCEKPFALEIEEAEAACAEVERAGVFLQVGQCIRFWPEYQALEEFMKSGRGGRMVSLSMLRRAGRPSYSRDNWLNDARRSKGAALDLHIHDTDYVLHLLGRPKGVRSVGRREGEGWSHLFTQYLFDDVAATAEGGWDLPSAWGFQMAFQAIFENAAIDFDSTLDPTLQLTWGDGKKQPLPFAKPSLVAGGPTGGNISELGGYYNELAYFCRCLRDKEKPRIATGAQALESLRVVLAELRSLSEGHAISLE